VTGILTMLENQVRSVTADASNPGRRLRVDLRTSPANAESCSALARGGP
jgi:hypothetical protein